MIKGERDIHTHGYFFSRLFLKSSALIMVFCQSLLLGTSTLQCALKFTIEYALLCVYDSQIIKVYCKHDYATTMLMESSISEEKRRIKERKILMLEGLLYVLTADMQICNVPLNVNSNRMSLHGNNITYVAFE